MTLRVIYIPLHYSEIVFCDAPVGTSLFWPAQPPKPWEGKVHGRWRLCTPVGDSLEPRVRIAIICHEASERRLAAVVRDAASRLPTVRQNGGTLGVMLKRYGYKERKSLVQPFFPLDEDDILAVGFFHIMPQIRARWTELISTFAKEPPKPNLPTKIKPSRAATPTHPNRYGG